MILDSYGGCDDVSKLLDDGVYIQIMSVEGLLQSFVKKSHERGDIFNEYEYREYRRVLDASRVSFRAKVYVKTNRL